MKWPIMALSSFVPDGLKRMLFRMTLNLSADVHLYCFYSYICSESKKKGVNYEMLTKNSHPTPRTETNAGFWWYN